MLPCGHQVREVGHLRQEHAPFARPARAGGDNVCCRALGGKRNYRLFHYNGYCLSCFPSAWHLVKKEEPRLLAGYMWKSSLHKLSCIHCGGVYACPHIFIQGFLDRKTGCSPTLCYLNSLFPCSCILGLTPRLFPKHGQSLDHFTFGL